MKSNIRLPLLAALILAAMPGLAATISYTYDAAGRITYADYGGGKSISWTYDANGNLLARQVAGGGAVDLAIFIDSQTAELLWGQGNLLYVVTVTNRGDAAASPVQLVGVLDPKSVYVRSDTGGIANGQFHAENAGLNPGSIWSFGLEAAPVSTGQVIQLLAITNPVAAQASFTNLVVAGASSQTNNIPDWWAERYFTNAANCVASEDSDNDGVPNEDEFRAGTNPRDANSVFVVTDLAPAGANTLTFHFMAASGRVYHAEQTDNIFSNAWTALPDPQPGAGNEVTLTVTNLEAQQYFRLLGP